MNPSVSHSAPGPFSIDLERTPCERGELPRSAMGRSSFAAGLALLAHLALALTLVLQAPWSHGFASLMAVLGVPFAQASLIALWAAARPMPSPLRWAIAAVAAGWGWLVAMAVLPGLAAQGAPSAGWAAGLVTQVAVLLAVLSAWRWMHGIVAAGNTDRARRPTRRWLQYGLGSLLGWTALVALFLSFGKTAPALFGWSGEVTQWTFFRFLPIVGVFHAVDALLIVYSLASRRRLVARVLGAGVMIAALAWLQPRVLELLFGGAGGTSPTAALTLAGAQAAVLYATLIPVRICQWYEERPGSALFGA